MHGATITITYPPRRRNDDGRGNGNNDCRRHNQEMEEEVIKDPRDPEHRADTTVTVTRRIGPNGPIRTVTFPPENPTGGDTFTIEYPKCLFVKSLF